ncbi:MAG: PVC-type heme-binding CxxCH protein [Rhodothermales bacterium]
MLNILSPTPNSSTTTFYHLACLLTIFMLACIVASGCTPSVGGDQMPIEIELTIKQDAEAGTISVYREGTADPILTQNALSEHRPYLHPIMSPDGESVVTEYSPGHHKHQTGLYWGFTRVNGRDYFHNPEGDYWRLVSAEVLVEQGPAVKWKTVYDMLDEAGETVMQEAQIWEMSEENNNYVLDLVWQGTAAQDVTIGEYDYGGLFLRMPWTEGINGEAVNAARQRNQFAEGKRAMWLNVGMQIEGRQDMAHVTIFDHPDNAGFPQPWRVDGQLGVGPVRARMGDWQIAPGETEEIKHRMLVYTGEHDDVVLRDIFTAYSGQGEMYSTASLWGIAQQEGLEAEFLTPEMAVESMTVQEGFEVNAYAGEPMITQPMAFAWDDQGRMWVAENRDYESRGDGFSNSGDSRILILEDTDNDGKADSRKVFLEGIPFPSAIAIGFDGLYLGAPPHLLFAPDKNKDDKADIEDIEILLTGWGIRDRHETINSFHWGPDGWLYGLEGFATPSRIREPDEKDQLYKHKDPFPDDIFEREGVDINGGVWRYHPIKKRFEVVAHGFSNPWGIDYDAKGQMFISACVIPHLFHVIPGGIYQRQGGRHFNPYVYSDIQTIVDHRHRSAHGGARIYQSDAFPEEHRGRLFMANIHEHAVLSDVLETKGSGFVATHGDDFLMANNAQWIGFSMEIGPEGAMYVLDWHDADICGKDVHDKDTGRIFRIAPEQSLAEDWAGRYGNLNDQSDAELAELQISKSDWHARRARVILQHRATMRSIDEPAVAMLERFYKNDDNIDYRLRALWAMHVINALTEAELLDALEDKNEYVRAWAVQLLTEDHAAGARALEKFQMMAKADDSAVVRKYLAAALQRIDMADRWGIVEGLVQHAEDADDDNIPLMSWFGIEPLVALDAGRALDIAGVSKIPLISEYVARRAVDADEIDLLVGKVGTLKNARKFLLTGMLAGLEGRTDLETPANWPAIYSELQGGGEVTQLAIQVGQQFGDAEAAQQLLSSLSNNAAPIQQRNDAIKALASKQRKELVDELPTLLEDEDLQVEAIRAVAAYDSEALGRQLLAQYDHFSAEAKREVVQAMATRPTYGWMLAQAIQSGAIKKADIPVYVARQLRRVVGNGFVEIWGPIDSMSSDKEAAYARYKDLLTNSAVSAADAGNGKLVFQQTCGTCHKMYEEGGEVGPDLTGSNRANLDYILSNMLSPSEVIQDDYKLVVVTTQDGRTYMGNVSGEDDRQVTMRIVGQGEIVIGKSTIQSREVTPNSMMPEGLLQALADDQVLDLVAFLRTNQ